MRSALLAILTVVLAFTGQAFEKPNFTGTWKLDPLRSRIESVPQAKNTVLKIEQQEPKIKITLSDGKTAGDTFELTTDGAEQKVTVDGQPATASAAWDDDRLVLTVARDTPGGPVTEVRRAKLGDRGAIMTTVLSIKDKDGEKTGFGFYVKE
jgi:hypothetical protein